MSFLGAVGLLVIYLVYKDNRTLINEHIQSKVKKKEIKDYERKLTAGEDREKKIREAVLKEGTKADIALYWKMQEVIDSINGTKNENVPKPFTYSDGFWNCPECGYSIPRGSKNCSFCGAKLRFNDFSD